MTVKKTINKLLLTLLLLGSAALYPQTYSQNEVYKIQIQTQQKQKYYCKYCGTAYTNVGDLTLNQCPNHPLGKRGYRHELYEGSEKAIYTCKYCGAQYRDLVNLTRNNCIRHPAGKGRCHEPAL
jgi:protein-arginine kinase activator protein McsA